MKTPVRAEQASSGARMSTGAQDDLRPRQPAPGLPTAPPRLIFVKPEVGNQICELPDGTLTIGRSRGNHLVILDESVSGDHCELLVHGSDIIVRERGSRNGTFVDGVRVETQSGVKHGQTLRFGRVEAVLQFEPAAWGDETDITGWHEYCRAVQCSSGPSRDSALHQSVFTTREVGVTGGGTRFLAPVAAPVPECAHQIPAAQEFQPVGRSKNFMVLTLSSLIGRLRFLLRHATGARKRDAM